MRMGHVASARVRSRPYQGAEAPHQRMGLLPGERRRVRCGADRRRYGLRGAHLASVMDFAQATSHTASVISPFPMGASSCPPLGRGRDLLREQPRIVPLRGCWRAAPPQRVVRGLRRRRRPDVRARAGRGAARFDGDQHAMGRRPARVLLQPEDRRHAGEGQFQEGAFGARFCPENSFGLLDWGRGVWTRDNTCTGPWRSWQDGRRFGLNLATGSATRRRLPRTWCSSTVLRTSCTAWTSASPRRRAVRTRRRRPIATSSCSPGI